MLDKSDLKKKKKKSSTDCVLFLIYFISIF